MDTEKDTVKLSRIMTPCNFYWQGDKKTTEAWLEEKLKFWSSARLKRTIAFYLNDFLDVIMFPRIPGGYDFGWTSTDPLTIGYQGRDDGTILIEIKAVRIND